MSTIFAELWHECDVENGKISALFQSTHFFWVSAKSGKLLLISRRNHLRCARGLWGCFFPIHFSAILLINLRVEEGRVCKELANCFSPLLHEDQNRESEKSEDLRHSARSENIAKSDISAAFKWHNALEYRFLSSKGCVSLLIKIGRREELRQVEVKLKLQSTFPSRIYHRRRPHPALSAWRKRKKIIVAERHWRLFLHSWKNDLNTLTISFKSKMMVWSVFSMFHFFCSDYHQNETRKKKLQSAVALTRLVCN